MTPTPLRLGVMDSFKPGLVVTLQVEVLSMSQRVWRALKRLGLVSGVGVLIIPIPIVHACGALIALVAGPVAAIFAFQAKGVVHGGDIECPKCSKALKVPEKLVGWPARFQCLDCKAMVELKPVEREDVA